MSIERQIPLSASIRIKPGAMEVFGALKPSTGKAGVSFERERVQSRKARVAETVRKTQS